VEESCGNHSSQQKIVFDFFCRSWAFCLGIIDRWFFDPLAYYDCFFVEIMPVFISSRRKPLTTHRVGIGWMASWLTVKGALEKTRMRNAQFECSCWYTNARFCKRQSSVFWFVRSRTPRRWPIESITLLIFASLLEIIADMLKPAYLVLPLVRGIAVWSTAFQQWTRVQCNQWSVVLSRLVNFGSLVNKTNAVAWPWRFLWWHYT